MPLILLCGQPCSGKTKVAAWLAEHLRDSGLDVLVVSEDSLSLERDSAYKDASSEKNTRGLLKSAVDRNLRGKRIIILDSLNNIKGYRYELWCIAKAAATRYCVVHSEVPTEVSRQWNSARSAASYCSTVFEDLTGRFEPPDTRNRWDTPLMRVDPRVETYASTLQPAIAIATGNAVVGSRSAPLAGPLTPNLATKNPELSTTNLLNELDRAAQVVVDTVIDAQSRVAGDAVGTVHFQEIGKRLQMPKAVTLPELRRHKRAFLKLATQNNWTRLKGAEDAQIVFIDYLQQNLD